MIGFALQVPILGKSVFRSAIVQFKYPLNPKYFWHEVNKHKRSYQCQTEMTSDHTFICSKVIPDKTFPDGSDLWPDQNQTIVQTFVHSKIFADPVISVWKRTGAPLGSDQRSLPSIKKQNFFRSIIHFTDYYLWLRCQNLARAYKMRISEPEWGRLYRWYYVASHFSWRGGGLGTAGMRWWS